MKEKETRRSTNIVRTQPDYYGSYTESKMLANRIEYYWRTRGYPKVRVWVEESKNLEDGRNVYAIRSNINFNVTDAEKGNYV